MKRRMSPSIMAEMAVTRTAAGLRKWVAAAAPAAMRARAAGGGGGIWCGNLCELIRCRNARSLHSLALLASVGMTGFGGNLRGLMHRKQTAGSSAPPALRNNIFNL